MTDFYTEMGAVATELLSPTSSGGLGQGSITLVKYTAVAPAEPWLPPPSPIEARVPLLGAARGVGKDLIGVSVENGGQIVATDLMVIVAPFAGGVDPTDVLEIDGAPVTILSVQRVPEAGITSAWKFVVRA